MLIAILLFVAITGSASASTEIDLARSSVVRIETIYNQYNYYSPWERSQLGSSGGSGFIINNKWILTNAHVVSLANRIRVQRPNQRKDYPAIVKYIAHDCDLAILEVEDGDFFKDSVPMKIGNTPELNTPVNVVGFPIGGDRLSITRGIVSRIDMDRYSHSNVDYHLTVQVDAAINPGNSGGPAIQNGEVIGVAFQVLTKGENLGYLIPPPVIRKFLEDIRDGRYDGYIELGTLAVPTANPVLKKRYGLEDYGDNSGVLIYKIIPDSTVDGVLQKGDILLRLNDQEISETGDVEAGGRLIPYPELVDNLSAGREIDITYLRDGEQHNTTVPLKITDIFAFKRKNYDNPPEYRILGGLVFQPLNADLLNTYANTWKKTERTEIFYRYVYYLTHDLYRERKRDVILTRRLSDPVNAYANGFEHQIVEKVNGKNVDDFEQFSSLVNETIKKEKYLILKFYGISTPMVFRSGDLIAGHRRILRRYGIKGDRRIYPSSGFTSEVPR